MQLGKNVTRVLMAMLLIAAVADCQAFHIRLYGLVTEHFSGDGMKGVQVRLVKDSVERETVFTNHKGSYEIYLERGYEYQVWFYRDDLVPKFVRIDARGIPLFPDVPFYEMDVQMTMFALIAGFDFSVFDEPVALASYKHSVRNLSWDIDWTEARQAAIARVMVLYDRAIADLKKQAMADNRKAKNKKRKRAYF